MFIIMVILLAGQTLWSSANLTKDEVVVPFFKQASDQLDSDQPIVDGMMTK